MFSHGSGDAFPAMLQGGGQRPIICSGPRGERLPVYRFDDIEVDTAAFRVERVGQAVPLEPKAFDLLVLLLEREGQVVTKAEILDAVWRQTAVSDNALTRIVAHLRKALGDDVREAKYIETVPTRGYRWRAPVARGESVAGTPSRSSVRSRPRRRAAWLAACAALVGVVALLAAVRVARVRAARRLLERPAMGSMWPSQLTVSPGLDAFPAFAPNGRALAFASDRSGSFELVVKPLTPGAREVALTSDGQQDVEPAWSPDGEYVAYHSMRRGGLWIVPALGGVPRRVTDFGSAPAWSPDGRRIAFQSDALADVGPGAFAANVPSTIWTVAADGSDAQRLTTPASPIGGHASPVWSPDGRRIVFTTYSAAPSRLWSVPAAGGAATLLAEARIPVHDPVFTPDGTALYYATGGPFVVRVRLSPAGLPEGEPEALATPGLGGVRHLSISGDGRRIAMTALTLRSNLWKVAVSPASGEASGAPVALTDDTARRKTTPVFSPDGRWIAYSGARGGSGSDVWIMNVDDGRTLPITVAEPASGEGSSPSSFRASWFPDGARLAFLTSDGQRTTFQMADLTSRRPQPLLTLPTATEVDDFQRSGVNAALDYRLSPDGKEVAFSEVDVRTGMPRVYVRPAGPGEPRPISPPDHSETYPAWSPDGRWIATELRTGQGTVVGVRSAQGGPVRALTSGPGSSWIHSWAPDSDRILFAGEREGIWNVWWVSRTTGRETKVTRYGGVNTFVRYPTWSPRGDRIVFELGEVRGNIWISPLPDRGDTAVWTLHRPRAVR